MPDEAKNPPPANPAPRVRQPRPAILPASPGGQKSIDTPSPTVIKIPEKRGN